MKSELSYFEIIYEITEYFTKHYDVQENMIFEVIKSGSWEVALKMDGQENVEKRKASTHTIEQAMQRFKNKGTHKDYTDLIEYILLSFPHIGIHDSDIENTRRALRKIVRGHIHDGDTAATEKEDGHDCRVDNDPENETDTDPYAFDSKKYKIPSDKLLIGRNVYGGIFLGRFPYILEHFGNSGANELLKEMIKNGYGGPRMLREINRSAKYRLKDLCIFNKTFIDLFGEDDFYSMMKDSAKRRGIVGVFIKWAGTPKLAIQKGPEYWSKFYDFGIMESKIVEDGCGIIWLKDSRVNSLFCASITHYFRGVGEAIGYKLKVEHTKCVFKGDNICEWELIWCNDEPRLSIMEDIIDQDRGSTITGDRLSGPELYKLTISELDLYVGGILAKGVTDMALNKVGASEDYVTVDDMRKAIKVHIAPTLPSFLSPEKVEECINRIEKKICS